MMRRKRPYWGFFGRQARRRCPHSELSPIYGDDINRVGGWRLRCNGCARYLDGNVRLVFDRETEERKIV